MRQKKQTIIRDISWLAFNARVLQEAQDPRNHVYDRLRFLGIFSNNLDEFFRVRVAALSRMARLGKQAKMHMEAHPDKILKEIQAQTLEQQQVFDRIYAGIIKELGTRNIFIRNDKQLNKEQKIFVENYFDEYLRTQIIPLMIESIPQPPLLHDKSIYLACMLGSRNNAMLHRYALIKIPTRILPRFIILPAEGEMHNIILLEDIIRYNLPKIFAPFGFDRFLGYIIKVTRDAELDLDNDIHSNMISELEKGLKNRRKGRTTRFVYDRNIDGALKEYLIKRLGITRKDAMIPGGRIHNFKDFMDFPASVFNDLPKRPKPFVHPLLQQPCRIMNVLDQRDVMLHFPYHSFDPILDLLREAAIDPFVQSIKITCYRLAKESKVVNALLNAVRNGKQVTVMLELRARFDEEANLEWKKRLEEEGIVVLLGIPDMKVHAKLCVIKKKEFNKIHQYAFISTGNFNENTARYYGDHCLLTSNKAIIMDINRVFNLLQANQFRLETLKRCKSLITSPVQMRQYFSQEIQKEINVAKKKKKAHISVKLNSLVDQELITKLYEAAQAGVKIDLIIRGISCAYTDLPSFKNPIKAISIIDEFLEHARVFIFHNQGKPTYYISSADWMIRNLDHRVEVACPIYDTDIQEELSEILRIQLADNTKARILDNKQQNHYREKESEDESVNAQLTIYNYLKNKKY